MYPGYDLLGFLRIDRVTQGLLDPRLMPQQLVFNRRVPTVDAFEGEILARNIQWVQIADIVTDDAKAVTYREARAQVENTLVPNIKHGQHITQSDLVQFSALAQNRAIRGGNAGIDEIFGAWLPTRLRNLIIGIWQRIEALKVAMHLDQMTYNRFGVNFSTATGSGPWGIPADLKVNTQYPWSDPVNATPVNDVWAIKLVARVRYGMEFDRLTMSTQAFRYMIATTEFLTKARVNVPLTINLTALPTANIDQFRTLAENVLGCTIELYDARFFSQGADGTATTAPYLPVNKVILDSRQNDGDPTVHDFANAVTAESQLSELLPNTGTTGVIGQIPAGRRGPLAYASVDPSLNPPELMLWAVARGFPRKVKLQANAVLTVGQFADSISPQIPF